MPPRTGVRQRAERGQASREKWLAQREQINEQVRENIPTLDAILPSHMNAAQFAAIVSGLLARDDDLALAALQNPTSFLAALADCARLGLVPGDGYALIGLGVGENSTGQPEVLGLSEYTGEIELIYRTGLVEAVIAEVVFSNDHYVAGRTAADAPEWSRGPTEFASDAQRGEPIGAFCYCVLKSGGNTKVVRMNRDEIMAHRSAAKTRKIWDGDFWRSMWLKSVVHEQYKWVSKSPEFRESMTTASAALSGSAIGALNPASPITEPAEVPALRVRAITVGSNGNGEPAAADEPSAAETAMQHTLELFARIGCTEAAEQLAVVQAVVPNYRPGAVLSEQQLQPLIAQLQQFIDDADDAVGDGDEFEGRTPYDVLRDWLNSPGSEGSDTP